MCTLQDALLFLRGVMTTIAAAAVSLGLREGNRDSSPNSRALLRVSSEALSGDLQLELEPACIGNAAGRGDQGTDPSAHA